jgi:hypothetical protein
LRPDKSRKQNPEGKNDHVFPMMRAETDKARLEAFMTALGNRVRGAVQLAAPT